MLSFQSPELSLPFAELVQALLPSTFQGQLAEMVVAPDHIVISLAAAQVEAYCPLCEQPSRHIHSRYARRVADLPWARRRVQLTLLVRRFFCRNETCARKVFSERLPEVVEPYARRTNRLRELLLARGFALGGEAGARQAEAWGSAVSPDTLLNLLRRHRLASSSPPRVLGVDDWSFRRGRHFGTILVDLERHRVVDLLAERSEDAFARWLREHPGVAIISRDRGGAYACAGRTAAPDALQVADRWHLLKNAGDAVQKLLTRQAAVLRPPVHKAEPHAALEAAEPIGVPPTPKRRPRHPVPPPQSVQRQRQLAMFGQVHRLVAAGWSAAAIARELKLNKLTVRKYRDMETFRDGRTTVRVSDVKPFRAYVEQRWAEGCTEAKQLWLELQAQGYRGSYRRVWSFTRSWQPPALPARPAAAPAPSVPARTPPQGMWLLMLPAKQLTEEDEAFRVQMCKRSEEVATAYGLVQAFRKVVQEGAVGQLDNWLERAKASGVRELRRFALGRENDAAAVRAALEHEWSNGQVEGQVTRLKLLKRQMYGRAKFDLLRARVLYRA